MNTLFSYSRVSLAFFLPRIRWDIGPSCLPVAVVGRQWVRDMSLGHQKQSPSYMPDTADRQEDEGRPEADALLIKKLWRKRATHQDSTSTPRSTTDPSQKCGEKPKCLWTDE